MSKKRSIWRDPNIYIGLAIAAVVIPSLIYVIVREVRKGEVDEDFVYVDIDGEQKALTLARPPLSDEPVWRIIADKSVDVEVLDKAINRWDTKTNKRVFRYEVNQEFFDHPLFMLAGDPSVKQAVDYRLKTVAITVGTQSGKEGCGGITTHHYDLKTGEVYWVDVSINPMFTYHKRSYESAIVHELGHALLRGHADHDTSIMRKKLNDRGVITKHSAEMVRKLWM